MFVTRSLAGAALAAAAVVAVASCSTEQFGTSPVRGDNSDPAVSAAWEAAPPIYQAAIGTALRGQGCPTVDRNLVAAQLKFASGFTTEATSPAGAAGPAQYLPATWDTLAPGVGATDPRNILDATAVLVAENCRNAEQLRARGHSPTLNLIASSWLIGVDNTLNPDSGRLAEDSGLRALIVTASPEGGK